MAFPPRVKTWQMALNQLASGNFTTAPLNLIFQIKNTLKSFAQLPWLVRGSSNSVAGAMDGVDRWAAIGNVVHGANSSSARSWIVLEQQATKLQMLVDLNGTDGSFPNDWGDVFWSNAAGFTGGSNTARPTATDEYPDAAAGHTTFTVGGFFAAQRYHVFHSTDGCNTMVVGRNSAINVCTMWLLGRLASPAPGWSHPNVVCLTNGQGNPSVHHACGMSNLTTLPSYAEKQGGGWCKVFQVAEATGPVVTLGAVASTPDDINSGWPVYPIGYYTEDATLFGPLGEWPDLWAPAKAGFADGDYFPDDGSRQAVMMGNYLFPWDGVTTWLPD